MAICVKKYFYELSGVRVFENKSPVSSTLQQDGLHKHVRHPLYLGTLLFVWGLFFFFPFLNNFIAVLAITLYTFTGIRLEEKKLLLEFGDVYRTYKEKVPMIFPLIVWRGGKKEEARNTSL